MESYQDLLSVIKDPVVYMLFMDITTRSNSGFITVSGSPVIYSRIEAVTPRNWLLGVSVSPNQVAIDLAVHN